MGDVHEPFRETEELPPGEYAIVEFFGHVTLVGRISEVERFGVQMLAIQPLFNNMLLPAVFHGGASIYRLTPCSPSVAWERQPTHQYQLPPPIFATVPQGALPAYEPPPYDEVHIFDRDGDPEEKAND